MTHANAPLSVEGVTGPGDAFAHYGRILRTLHLLQFIDSEAYRRVIGVQPNIGEGRHALARSIFFGRLGELRHAYREGRGTSWGHWAWDWTRWSGGTPSPWTPLSRSWRPAG